MSDCRAAGTRKANSPWLIVFLLLAIGFAPVLMAQDAPRTIHVFVALADNKNQGIVPVAAILGNGEDPQHNLYWGSAYGVKTFFSRSADWRLVASYFKPRPEVLERCVVKHRTANRNGANQSKRRRRDHRLAHAEGEQREAGSVGKV